MTEVSNLPGTLAANPRIDRWLRFNTEDRTVSLLAGRVEIGQGVLTALAQILAEELDVSIERVKLERASTRASPDEGYTASSASIDQGGGSLRQACAEARAVLLGAAAERLGIAAENLTVEDGRVGGFDRIRELTYWDLPCAELLRRDATGLARPKPPASYRVVGVSVPRADIATKVAGEPVFLQDLALPDMVHGRVVRPPSYEAELEALDAGALENVSGVLALVRDGRFIGVVAEREEQAVQARRVLQGVAHWRMPKTLACCADVHAFLRDNADDPVVSAEVAAARPAGTRRLTARYTKPYIAHASMGPSCAVARWDADRARLEVWTHGQGVFPLQAALSRVLAVAPEQITVSHVDGAGCYGHNGADDAALDAALLARAVAPRPVKLQWMREDEFRWEPYGPAMEVEIAAELDANDSIVHWEADLWSQPHNGRPGRVQDERHCGLVAAWHLELPYGRAPVTDSPLARGGGSDRNAAPLYSFPSLRVRKHLVKQHPLRVSTLRALGAYANVFAIESFMDELAQAVRRDPVAFRLAHMRDARARAVIELAARKAEWSMTSQRVPGRGRGFAFGQYKNRYGYLALVCEVDVQNELRVTRVVCAADAGQIVNPDGLKNQIEGGIVQAVSWTLKERVTYDDEKITSVDWSTYPILGFGEVPDVEVHLIDQPGAPPLGAGEISCGPTAAAIANAVCSALGVRVRDLPITRERIVAAIGSG